MILDRLTHLRGQLERIEPLLEARENDHSAQQLACALKATRREIAAFEAEEEHDNDTGHELLACGIALLNRIRTYASAWRLAWFDVVTPAPGTERDQDDTVVLHAAEILAILRGMPAGATAPPAEMTDLLEEAQLVGRHSTVPAPAFPPERDTNDFTHFSDDLDSDEDLP